MTNPAAWVRHVAVAARDDVEVEVRHRLARGIADVDPDVESVGVPVLTDDTADRLDRPEQGGALLGRRFEPGRDVPARHDQRVALGHREAVPECEDVLETQEDA